MSVPKYLAELCALLIEEFYGELPSRIFSSLLSRGRSSLAQLGANTSLTPTHLRHGLAVLVQHSLVYYLMNDMSVTIYEANWQPAYDLLRTGKVLEMVESQHGPAASHIMQNLLLSGITRISDLADAYEHEINQSAQKNDDGDYDPLLEDALNHGAVPRPSMPKSPGLVKSRAHLNAMISRLIEADLVEHVHAQSLVSPDDIYGSIEREVTDKVKQDGLKGTKAKTATDDLIAEKLREVRQHSKLLKRAIERDGGWAAKKRKLVNGSSVAVMNGAHEPELDALALDAKSIIRVNYDKCHVELRNRYLVQCASDMIGETSSYVYAVLLRLLTKKISRCRARNLMDGTAVAAEDDRVSAEDLGVTTREILDQLSTSVDVSLGIAKVSRNQIDSRHAERIQEHPPCDDDDALVVGNGNLANGGEYGSDDESEYSEAGDDDGARVNRHADAVRINGHSEGGGGSTEREESNGGRIGQVRQHLCLLADTTYHFVRQRARDTWTVDFDSAMEKLREAELDVIIQRTSGRYGLRLVKILRDKGRLEEKTLPGLALMTKAEVQHKMLEMQMAGFVDLQELPRDAKGSANRTLYLWFSDAARCQGRMLSNAYKSMVRCLQMLDVCRRREKDVLALTERTDVKGREQEFLHKIYFDKYAKFLAVERQLLGQVMRLDDVVSAFRDY